MGGERTVVEDTPDTQQLENILHTDMVGTIFIKLFIKRLNSICNVGTYKYEDKCLISQ